jgi:phage tail sheath protein FI
VTVHAPGEATELFTNLDPAMLTEQLSSFLVEVEPVGTTPPTGPAPGPRRLSFTVTLTGGLDDAPALREYQAAVRALDDVSEVALVVAPDLHVDLTVDDDRYAVLAAALRGATDEHDRLVIVDAPPGRDDAREAVAWFDELRLAADPDTLRSGAAYHPSLWVPDPLGGPAMPQRLLPPAGLVAGAVSRLDRERGAHHTPANAPVFEAVDASRVYGDDDAALLETNGVNLLVCRCGRGLQIWGGRTLERRDPAGRFVAHRRLIHRLVRAIHRVAEPLVFDGNTPTLWLALTRAITAVLLEAFRAGALHGARPEEAFRVQCDDQTNPPEERDLGRCVCLISVAPAVPMEFITLRVAVSADGAIEVT